MRATFLCAFNGSKKLTRFEYLCLLAVFCVLAGCSEKQSPSGGTADKGKIIIKGSNTIGEELAPRLAAEYKKEHPAAAFEMESKGTGYGLAGLLAEQCDLAAASRSPIKDELDLARSRGIEMNDHVIGSYSVAVIVNAGSPLANLTREQVRDIFTGTVQNWKEVGGPDSPVHLYVRDPISGTYLGFRELAMENKPYASGLKTMTNYTGIVHDVAQDPGGIGYCSFDLATKPGIKALTIGGVAANATSVKEGKYPYSRVLHFYSNKTKPSSAATDFVRFVQSSRGQEVLEQTGFVRGF